MPKVTQPVIDRARFQGSVCSFSFLLGFDFENNINDKYISWLSELL